MKIERIHVYGFETALRAMRNPKDSWDRSDSSFGGGRFSEEAHSGITCLENPLIGQKDLKLALRLIHDGSVHRKFLRQIQITWDITIPRYVWQELDTYKVATVRNSCSTMHKLGHRDLTEDDFQDGDICLLVLKEQNAMGLAYRNKAEYLDPLTGNLYKGNELLAHMKRRLPEGFLQMATYTFNYETALGMYQWRRNHRMSEWSGPDGICEWLMRLPYFKTFVGATCGE
jgi:hypothetical protein